MYCLRLASNAAPADLAVLASRSTCPNAAVVGAHSMLHVQQRTIQTASHVGNLAGQLSSQKCASVLYAGFLIVRSFFHLLFATCTISLPSAASGAELPCGRSPADADGSLSKLSECSTLKVRDAKLASSRVANSSSKCCTRSDRSLSVALRPWRALQALPMSFATSFQRFSWSSSLLNPHTTSLAHLERGLLRCCSMSLHTAR